MKVHVHIERLVLEGLPVSTHDGARVGGAVEAELGRLLRTRGMAAHLRGGGAVPSLQAGTLAWDRGTSPATLGTRIGRSVYRGMGK